MDDIGGAIKEVFGFFREWNNADQKQKRYAIARLKRIERAMDVAEEIFSVVEDMLNMAHAQGLGNQREFLQIEARYRKLVRKFNALD